METTVEKLCENLPTNFLEYFKYVKYLGFTQDPNYFLLRRLF